MRIERDITVNAPVDKVYAMWTDFERFPTFMKHIDSVTRTGQNTLHWKATIGPVTKEWDAEIQGLVPNRSVTWRSVNGADNAGAVTMSERGNVTELHVVIEYNPSWMEALGEAATRAISGGVEEDLERFKRLAERQDPDRADSKDGTHMGEHGAHGTQVTYTRERGNS